MEGRANDSTRQMQMRMRTRTRVAAWALGQALAAAGLLVVAATPAAAQAVGDPVPFVVTSGNGIVLVAPSACDGNVAQALGGITLFGSMSPSGPYVGVLPKRAGLDGEGQPECGLFIVPGVPPGTYWVTVVFGFVATESVSVTAWQPITVGGGCTRAPKPPVLLGQPVIVGDDVSVAFGSPPDCGANQMLLDVGSTPFTSDIATFSVGSLAFAVNDVPAGTYYLRARSSNPFGTSKLSTVVPVTVPGGCGGIRPQQPLNPVVTVNGNVVTLSWSQSAGLPQPPTFYVVSLKEPSTGLVTDNIVLPATTSISAALAAGTYRVALVSGNACATSTPADEDLTFTVP
jgi:hypothetical protein